MKIVEQSYEIMTEISPGGIKELQQIERAGRVCYKSEDKITDESAMAFVGRLIKSGHEAMLEHSSLAVKFITDRGITHELVRHRVASFAQESTRYCNYSKEKFGEEITVIRPTWYENSRNDKDVAFRYACRDAETAYFELLYQGLTPQDARAVLPTCLKAELVMTANYREWRHIFKLRTAPDAHPQMRALLTPLLEELRQRIPVVFEDIGNA